MSSCYVNLGSRNCTQVDRSKADESHSEVMGKSSDARLRSAMTICMEQHVFNYHISVNNRTSLTRLLQNCPLSQKI